MTDAAFLDARGRPRVAVTGIGVKTPAGTDVATMWYTVLRPRECAALPHQRFDAIGAPGAVRRRGPRLRRDAEYFGPKEVRRQDRVTQLGFAAAVDALADAGELGADPSRCAVIAATGVGGLESMEINQHDVHRARREPRQPVLRHDDDAERDRGRDLDQLRLDRAQHVHRHRLRGRNARDRRGCAPHPRRHRRRGRRRRHRGGCHAAHDLRVRAHGRAEHPQRRSRARVASVRRRPRRLRDGRRRGAFVILEPLERAIARGAHVYGEVVGYGRNGDAYHITAPSPGGAGAAVCMQLALDDAGPRRLGRSATSTRTARPRR